MVHPEATLVRNGWRGSSMRLPGIRPFVRQGDFIPDLPPRQLRRPRRADVGAAPKGFAHAAAQSARPGRGRHRLDDLVGTGFVLIGAGVDPRDARCRVEGAVVCLGARSLPSIASAAVRPEPCRVPYRGPDRVRGSGRQLPPVAARAWCRQRQVAIVRPDKFVFALVSARALPAATRESTGGCRDAATPRRQRRRGRPRRRYRFWRRLDPASAGRPRQAPGAAVARR